MLVWFLLILYLFILKLLFNPINQKQNIKRFLIWAGIGITLIMGFRYPGYEIVYDLNVYYNFYKKAAESTLDMLLKNAQFEPGFVIFNYVFAHLVSWTQFVLILEAFICVGAACYFIYKNSDEPFLGVLFYITIGTMSFQLTGFRQAIAMSICLISTEFIKKNKFIPFVLMVLLAFSFHKTAIVFVISYFIAKRGTSVLQNMISFIGIPCGVFFAQSITRFGNDIFGMNYSGYKGSIIGGIVPILIFTGTVVLWLLNKDDSGKKIFFNILIIGLAIYLMRYTTLAFERISFYFTSVLLVVLPDAIMKFKDIRTRQFLYIYAAGLSILLFIYRLNSAEWANYRFYWQ